MSSSKDSEILTYLCQPKLPQDTSKVLGTNFKLSDKQFIRMLKYMTECLRNSDKLIDLLKRKVFSSGHIKSLIDEGYIYPEHANFYKVLTSKQVEYLLQQRQQRHQHQEQSSSISNKPQVNYPSSGFNLEKLIKDVESGYKEKQKPVVDNLIESTIDEIKRVIITSDSSDKIKPDKKFLKALFTGYESLIYKEEKVVTADKLQMMRKKLTKDVEKMIEKRLQEFNREPEEFASKRKDILNISFYKKLKIDKSIPVTEYIGHLSELNQGLKKMSLTKSRSSTSSSSSSSLSSPGIMSPKSSRSSVMSNSPRSSRGSEDENAYKAPKPYKETKADRHYNQLEIIPLNKRKRESVVYGDIELLDRYRTHNGSISYIQPMYVEYKSQKKKSKKITKK